MDFLTILIVICLIALAIFTFLMLRRVKKKQNIPREETEGVLTKVTMAKYRGEETGFYVKYKVDGKEYLAILGDAGAKNIFKTTPVGTKVTVLYKPDNPQDAYAELRNLN